MIFCVLLIRIKWQLRHFKDRSTSAAVTSCWISRNPSKTNTVAGEILTIGTWRQPFIEAITDYYQSKLLTECNIRSLRSDFYHCTERFLTIREYGRRWRWILVWRMASQTLTVCKHQNIGGKQRRHEIKVTF